MRTEQPTKCFEPLQNMRVRIKNNNYTDRSKAVVLLCFYVTCFCISFGDVSQVCLYRLFSVRFGLLSGHLSSSPEPKAHNVSLYPSSRCLSICPHVQR